MSKFMIYGGKKLKGDVFIGGAKNAAVAIIPATILSDGICRIENIPNISDITLICKILIDMGALIKMINKHTLEIDSTKIVSPIAPQNSVQTMRASSYLMGALLGKFSKAVVALPGGCNFGIRPIDQHLKGFSALGAKHKIINGMVNVICEKLVGNTVYLDIVSVGATINIMLAAVKAEGLTVIENAAKEPHVVDLANFLNCMGADIRGGGTDIIKIYGVKKLNGVTYSIIPDQIEAGTYMAMAVATCGEIVVNNIIPKHLESISAKLEEIGAKIYEYSDSLKIFRNQNLNKCNVKTMPYPGFPTDMQPQITTLLSCAGGNSIITETVWDNRFKYIEELRRMGAQISVDGKIAIIEGVPFLTGAQVKATDLRAGAALILAGLIAKGKTFVAGAKYVDRGYENIVKKLADLGANISVINERKLAETASAL